MFAPQTLGTVWEQVRRRGPAKDKNRPLDLDEFPTKSQREPLPPPPPPLQQPQQQPMGSWSTPEYMAQIDLMVGLACQESDARMQYLNGVNGLVVILQQDVATKTATIVSLMEENMELKRRLALRPPPPSEEIQAKVASLEAELAKSQTETAELERMNMDLAMRSVDRRGEIEDLKAKLLAATTAGESSGGPTKEELDQARAAVSWIEGKHSELVVDLDAAMDKLKKAGDEGNSMKLTNSMLHQSLQAVTEDFKRAMEELEQLKAARKDDGELTALKDKVVGLTERNRALKRDISEYKVQLASTLEECKHRDKANRESTRRVEEQNCRIAFLQRQLGEANAKVSRVQQERSAKVGAINELWEKAVETAADIETQPDLARMHVEMVLAKEELAKSQSHCQTLMTLNRRLMSGI